MEFNATFLATIISFIIFVFLMNIVLYEPIRKIVLERKEFIDSNLFSAEENNKKSEEILKKKDEKIGIAKNDAKIRYTDTVDEYKAKKNDIILEAKKNSAEKLDQANENLTNASNDAKERLKGSMNDLANDIVEKMIGYRSEVSGFDDDTVNRILYH